MQKRILFFEDLKSRNIVGSRMTLHRRRKEPDFPKAVEVGGRVGFFEHEIEQYLETRPRRVATSSAEVAY